MKRDLLAGFEEQRSVVMPSPAELRAMLALPATASLAVANGRRAIRDILERRDARLLVIVGPCSIHDPVAALDYAERLAGLAREVADSMLVVMRVYFEKPRTSIGWKGLINDPHLDDSFRVAEGMHTARRLLLEIASLGLPAAVEALDPVSPHYLNDLIGWAAIGARTTESQTHREMASGLPVPVGFKNGTDGSVDTAINAIRAAARSHAYLGIDAQGRTAVVHTDGNPHAHLVLRGGSAGPNYDAANVARAELAMREAGIQPTIVIDCAHGNSSKDHRRQSLVLEDVIAQKLHGNVSIVGVMIESFIEAGNQPMAPTRSQLRYGCSVTDPCVDWPTTQAMLRLAHGALQ
ncbi:MAG TPA: 3-deoxy-7-phosphoheptulonate synthase [Telluria sp.]